MVAILLRDRVVILAAVTLLQARAVSAFKTAVFLVTAVSTAGMMLTNLRSPVSLIVLEPNMIDSTLKPRKSVKERVLENGSYVKKLREELCAGYDKESNFVRLVMNLSDEDILHQYLKSNRCQRSTSF